MEPNLRDTPLRRFSTFWWGIALFVVFGIASIFIREYVHGEKSDVDTARGEERASIREKNSKDQDEAMKVDPTTLCSKASVLLDFTPADSAKPHNKQFEKQ